ncbi:LutB/LldF family L-lactate oxidation iron-sulfur protein [candidate division KSB1 bacterium]
MSSLQERIRDAVNNKELHTAISRATTQLRQRRSDAFTSQDNFDAIKESARHAKLTVLHNLEKNLLEFENRLVENGIKVHWAGNGEEACSIVSGIAEQTNAKKIVKSKSMTTEEIHLNDYLEKRGLTVRETDLGEYIIQLAGEKPSHIVAPILHMMRERVGSIMHKKLNVPYTHDIEQLTRIAREKLREDFLEADIGITGANFGVVDTGTICIVTNEGNGRMVTTLPRTHIVIMGIEKLVPSLSDLDDMLKLLARSATGQKITVYTTLINGPVNRDEENGPEEMHLILLDNGRTKILGSEQAEILCCIRCGACLNACPVYKCIGGHAYGDIYSGPVGSVVTPGLRGIEDWGELSYISTLCGECKEACPIKIDIPGMLTGLRKNTTESNKWNFALLPMKLFLLISTNPRLYKFVRKFISTLLYTPGVKLLSTKLLNRIFSGWTQIHTLRIPVRKTFQELWKDKGRTS